MTTNGENEKELEERVVFTGREIVENMRRYSHVVDALGYANVFKGKDSQYLIFPSLHTGFVCEEHFLRGMETARGCLREYYSIPEEIRKHLNLNKKYIKERIKIFDTILNKARKRKVYPGGPSPGAI